jgi:membrane-bound metal-dependent hydrolase YbcI (DUF457 family)
MRRILFLDLPITAVLLVALIIFSDFTDVWWESNITRMQWLALDTILQTMIALLAAAPLLNLPAFKRKTHLWLLALLAVITALDLDHFLFAGSFQLEDALSLGERPLTHSLFAAILLGAGGWAVTRQPQAGLLFAFGLSAHILHDAQNSGAPLFWPFYSETIFMPLALHIIASLAVLFLAAAIAAAANRRSIWRSGVFSVLQTLFD